MSKRDYTREICVKIVQTHPERKKRIREAIKKRESLTDTMKSVNITDMPINHNGVGRPTEKLYEEIEYLDTYIAIEQNRVEVVEAAIMRMGNKYSPKVQKEIRDGILIHLSPDCDIPQYQIPYPFEKEHFYNTRKEFLRDIAHNLYLIPRL